MEEKRKFETITKGINNRKKSIIDISFPFLLNIRFIKH